MGIPHVSVEISTFIFPAVKIIYLKLDIKHIMFTQVMFYTTINMIKTAIFLQQL